MTKCIIIKDDINDIIDLPIYATFNTKPDDDFINSLILHIPNKENFIKFLLLHNNEYINKLLINQFNFYYTQHYNYKRLPMINIVNTIENNKIENIIELYYYVDNMEKFNNILLKLLLYIYYNNTHLSLSQCEEIKKLSMSNINMHGNNSGCPGMHIIEPLINFKYNINYQLELRIEKLELFKKTRIEKLELLNKLEIPSRIEKLELFNKSQLQIPSRIDKLELFNKSQLQIPLRIEKLELLNKLQLQSRIEKLELFNKLQLQIPSRIDKLELFNKLQIEKNDIKDIDNLQLSLRIDKLFDILFNKSQIEKNDIKDIHNLYEHDHVNQQILENKIINLQLFNKSRFKKYIIKQNQILDINKKIEFFNKSLIKQKNKIHTKTLQLEYKIKKLELFNKSLIKQKNKIYTNNYYLEHKIVKLSNVEAIIDIYKIIVNNTFFIIYNLLVFFIFFIIILGIISILRIIYWS